MRWRSIPAMVMVLASGLVSITAYARHNAEALFNEQDIVFLQHMILHHEQAVAMALLAPSRTGRTEFMRFTDYVKRAQAAEVDLMRHWLDLARDRGFEAPSHGPHGDPPMAGMLSSAQMEALAAARGAEFERLWLEGMIYHHQGAIDMAHAQQLQQLENGRRPFGLSVLVEDILVEQRAEITKMRAWLHQWGLARSPEPGR